MTIGDRTKWSTLSENRSNNGRIELLVMTRRKRLPRISGMREDVNAVVQGIAHALLSGIKALAVIVLLYACRKTPLAWNAILVEGLTKGRKSSSLEDMKKDVSS